MGKFQKEKIRLNNTAFSIQGMVKLLIVMDIHGKWETFL